MPRRIYIVDQIDANTAADAAANNCPEIVLGIPPALAVELAGAVLPLVYEEPVAPESPPEPLMLRSPDGSYWRMTTDDNGIITTEKVN
jgi:hypothetical protein